MTQFPYPSHILEALSANIRAQNILGWQHTRQVAYLHRHPELTSTCLYHWDYQRKQPVPTASQQLCFILEDIYCEVRGEFNSKKLVVDMDLGLDGKLRLITGLSTQAATSLLASLSALSPTLLIGSIELRVKPGTTQGVVLPFIFIDNEWVDGRPLRRDEKGQPIPSFKLLKDVQDLLRDGLNVDRLPHELKQARKKNAYAN